MAVLKNWGLGCRAGALSARFTALVTASNASKLQSPAVIRTGAAVSGVRSAFEALFALLRKLKRPLEELQQVSFCWAADRTNLYGRHEGCRSSPRRVSPRPSSRFACHTYVDEMLAFPRVGCLTHGELPSNAPDERAALQGSASEATGSALWPYQFHFFCISTAHRLVEVLESRGSPHSHDAVLESHADLNTVFERQLRGLLAGCILPSLRDVLDRLLSTCEEGDGPDGVSARGTSQQGTEDRDAVAAPAQR